MNKRVIAAAVCAAAFFVSPAAIGESDIRVILDGKELVFDVRPQIINDRTMVPLRVIFEALGAKVEWNGDTETVTAANDETVISLTIGSYEITVNGNVTALESPAVIIDNRTLVPVRAVSEGFGAAVGWDGDTRTVTITSAKPEPTAAPTAAPAAAPTAEPATEEDVPSIGYNRESEQDVPFMRGFELLSAEPNDDGSYSIKYTFRTFKEGRGDVIVFFNCLDSGGKVIDTFGGTFRGTDYTWSVHEAEAVIPGDTVAIEFAKDKSSS